MSRKKAVCLISGGLDSTVAATYAKSSGYDIYALTIVYGQKHQKEVDSAKKIARELKAKEHKIIRVPLEQIGGSALIDRKMEIPSRTRPDEIGHEIPQTYVPARNIIFLSIAAAYAEVVGAEAIFIGVNAVDYSGYPDCRPEFIKAMQEALRLGMKTGVKGRPIRIETPLINMTKAEIVKLGYELRAPLHLTWSCYRGGEKACGRCDSCILRLKGFMEAGIPDPIEYEYYPEWYIKGLRERGVSVE